MNGGYSPVQIALHWIIVLMIPVQYLTGGSVERTHHAVHMGMEPDRWDIIQHLVHNYCGMAIGVLMGLRLLVRLFVRPPGKTQKSAMAMAARALHLAFYAAIIGQACLGFVASYLTFSVAPLHVLGSWIILGMVFIHVLAAAWHTLVLKDDTIDRMTGLPANAAPTDDHRIVVTSRACDRCFLDLRSLRELTRARSRWQVRSGERRQRMTRPSELEVAAWINLVGVHRDLMAAFEGDVKDANLPPLSWFDVLVVLSRQAEGSLRLGKIEERTLLSSHDDLSALIDRIGASGLVAIRSLPDEALSWR